MSLHLGNLSSRIRREDLERVFRRFGRNTIQIKDKYGFVVYDLPENAEKALRALKGKNICGERISVTWSNKQPKPFQRFSKCSRFYEPYHRRNFTRREDYATKEETTHHERGFKRVPNLPDDESRGPTLDGFVDKEKYYPCDDVVDHGGENGEKEVLMGEDLPVETTVVDSGRWGEPVCSTLNIKEAENVASLDRYEPYHGYARDEDENRYKATSYRSPARESSREALRIDRNFNTTVKGADDSRYQLKCYDCGMMGHIKRNCPQGNAPRQARLARFDSRQDNDIHFRVTDSRRIKRVTPASLRRSKLRSPPPSRRKGDENLLVSRKHPRVRNNETSPSGKDRDFQRKKKHKREHRDLVKVPRSERDGSSTQHSGSMSSSSRSHSRSRSASSGINSHSRSRSTPESFSKHSASSTSRSVTSSSKSRSQSRSKSRSASPAFLSLSVSLSPEFQSSHREREIKETVTPAENHLDKDIRSESMHTLIDQREIIGDDSNTDNPIGKNENGTLIDEKRLSSLEIGDEMKMDNTSQLHEDRTVSKVNDPNKNQSENYVVAGDDLSSNSSGEMRDLQISVSLETDGTVSKQNAYVPSTSMGKNSTSISSQEMCVVLKHYGLPTPNENEENLSVETFFGCARLWPWELIYYRRLKKGPISTENYARRIAQNEEFGIVDKYVRSSSGWEECDQSS